jgi:protein tyrosine/serine phosphatase
MPATLRWCLGVVLAGFVTVVPVVHYRCDYTLEKRFREVTPGALYRSGEMRADGFAMAVQRYGIRTIVNLQDEFPDPDIATGYFGGPTIKESDLCHRLGARYVFIRPELLPHALVAEQRPEAIDQFLKLLDDSASYPILIHCRAGLHRTGVMAAVYRMEHDGWTPFQALAELKANGFGEWPCSDANDYITQYILTYHPGVRRVADRSQ